MRVLQAAAGVQQLAVEGQPAENEWLAGKQERLRYRTTQRCKLRLKVMAHAQKPDFVFRRKGRVHLHLRGRQFSRLLAAEVCASAVVMLDTPVLR
jgi:hypothetical protein